MIIPIKGLTKPPAYSKCAINASTSSGGYTVPDPMTTAGETDKAGTVPAYKAFANYQGERPLQNGVLGHCRFEI